ncbi:MAG: hypothetical protein KME55_15250 [Nostoc indistinguendum CM1-VF10]|jgi:hypothetical protein|nr:hypothetical protein [Nostoc indistinguendum CM1-VF10]
MSTTPISATLAQTDREAVLQAITTKSSVVEDSSVLALKRCNVEAQNLNVGVKSTTFQVLSFIF